ncbi:MAG: hypothetical protein H5T86_01995 [Armatimonadetes bacterium]|nr:hypothetical protein [Armatimonadota bacterium]
MAFVLLGWCVLAAEKRKWLLVPWSDCAPGKRIAGPVNVNLTASRGR